MKITLTFKNLVNICTYLRGICICDHPDKKPDKKGDRGCWNAKDCPIWRQHES